MTETYVYRCPTHGIIESPTGDEDSGHWCPINDGGIDDVVCGEPVVGPFPVRERT